MTVTEDGDRSYLQVTARTVASRASAPLFAVCRSTNCRNFLMSGRLDERGRTATAPVAVNERYRAQNPSYMIRTRSSRALPEWAQVNGYRGGDDLPTMTKHRFDLNYYDWSQVVPPPPIAH